MARFIDIASHQDVTDAEKVAGTDVAGAWVKLTGELGYENPKRDQQVNALRDAGLAVGGYHFGDPRVDPVKQARHFGADAQRLGLLADRSLFPMFDAENAESVGLKWSSPEQLNHWIGTWQETLRQEFGVLDDLVYGSESWWGSWINPRAWGDAHSWNWIANYNGRPGVLKAWAHPQDALHQWRSNAVPFPGIAASGLDDNVTLNGHTRESLTIGKAGGSFMSLTSAQQDDMYAKVQRIYNAFWVTDEAPAVAGGPGPETVHDIVQRGINWTGTTHDDLAQRITAADENDGDGGPTLMLTDAQAALGFESISTQVGAMTREALDGLYARLVEANSVDAVREVLGQYVGRASVALEFERDEQNPPSGG